MTNVITPEHKALLEKALHSEVCADGKEYIGFQVKSWAYNEHSQELRDCLDWGLLQEKRSIEAFGFEFMKSLIVITDRGKQALERQNKKVITNA